MYQHSRASQIQAILEGKQKCLPPLRSSIVRIFISSTFSDMVCERNALMEHAYPKLKEFCKRNGLEFQVVDMRWGVREEAQDDHLTSSLCLKEIRNCQRLSMATNFVILFGQKYGYRPFPAEIPATEFEVLIKSLKDDGKETNLLETWFKKDTNAIPSTYYLQPVTSHYKNYTNESNPELREDDQQKWGKTFESLQNLLRKAAQLCFKNGQMDSEQKEKYFISVTEDEVREGVVMDKTPNSKVLFLRTVSDMNTALNHKRIIKFIDVKNHEGQNFIDEEAQQLLHNLRDIKVKSTVERSNTTSFSVKWSEKEGINAYDHQEYLQNLCEAFIRHVTQQVVSSLAKRDDIFDDPLLHEILQHLHNAINRRKMFHGREDMLSKIQHYLRQPQKRPLVVHGESGVGKTSIMGVAASRIVTWFEKKEPIVILRFLGTTSRSADIQSVLITACNQILRCLNQDSLVVPQDYQMLVSFFWELLENATSHRPIIIFFDSLDQLSSENHAHRLNWLARDLPDHVHIIVSTLPRESDLLSRLRGIIRKQSNYIEVHALDKAVSFEIVKSSLKDINRTLTEEQLEVLKKALNSCTLPLYTKLAYEEVTRWHSYTPLSVTVLQGTCKGIINKLFDRIEIQHGKTLVSHALAYITASRNGLSESELEDVLSLDDMVLAEIFTFWLPPVRRIPPLLWTRIRDDLQHYLVERGANEVTVLSWYHRQFKEVCMERYLCNPEFKVEIHSALADFFLGVWSGGKEKPFHYSEKLAQRLSITSRDSKADRKVSCQPLMWKVAEDSNLKKKEKTTNIFNKRKLCELPYHLFHSNRYDDLWKEVLFNYKWLSAKLKALSLAEILTDLSYMKQYAKGPKLGLLSSALRVAGSSLSQLPTTLASELIGRLKPYSHQSSLLEDLVLQCSMDGIRDCSLLPVFHCFDAPMEGLVFALEGHCKQVTDLAFGSSNELYSVSMDGTMVCWDTKTGDQLFVSDISSTNPDRNTEIQTSNSGHLVIDSYVADSPLCIFAPRTGHLQHSYGERRNGFIYKTLVSDNFVYREGDKISLTTGQLEKNIAAIKQLKNFTAIVVTSDDKYLLIGTQEITILLDMDEEDVVTSFPQKNIPSQILVTKDNSVAVIGYAVDCLVKAFCIDPSDSKFSQELWTFVFRDAIAEMPSFEIDLYTQEVSEMNLSQSGSFIVVNIQRCHLFVLDVNSGAAVTMETDSLNIPERHLTMSAFTSDECYVVAMCGKKLCVWNRDSGNLKLAISLQGSENDRFTLALSPTCSHMATVSNTDNTIRLWDLHKLQESQRPDLFAYSMPVDEVTVASLQKYMFIKTYHRLNSSKGYKYLDSFGIDVWNITTNSRKTFLPFDRYGQLQQMTCTRDGKFLLLLVETKSDKIIHIIDLETGTVLDQLFLDGCYRFSLSLDNHFLVTESKNSAECYEVKVWGLMDGDAENLETFTNCHSAVFTSDSKTVVCIQESKEIVTFSLTKGLSSVFTVKKHVGLLMPIPNHPNLVLATVIPKLSKFALKMKSVLVVDVNLKQIVSTLENVAPGGIKDVSKDGTIVVDGFLQVFEVKTGKLLVQVEKNLSCEKDLVKLTYRGEVVIWADDSPVDSVKAFHTAHKRMVANVGTHSKAVSLCTVDFSYTLAIGCSDGHVMIFRRYKMMTNSCSELEDCFENINSTSPEIQENKDLLHYPIERIVQLDEVYQKQPIELTDDELPQITKDSEDKIRTTASEVGTPGPMLVNRQKSRLHFSTSPHKQHSDSVTCQLI